MKKIVCISLILLTTTIAHSMQKRLSFSKKKAPNDTITMLCNNPNAKNHMGDPLFFKLKTITAVEECIAKGTNIYATDMHGANVLTHILNDEHPLELIEFYVGHSVSVIELNPLDRSCLLQVLTRRYLYYTINNTENFLKKAQYLLGIIPFMVNTIDSNGETALDLAYKCLEKFESIPEKKEASHKFIELLKENDGKTARELTEQLSV